MKSLRFDAAFGVSQYGLSCEPGVVNIKASLPIINISFMWYVMIYSPKVVHVI